MIFLFNDNFYYMLSHILLQTPKRMEGTKVVFNAFNTFYIRLYGVGHIVTDP